MKRNRLTASGQLLQHVFCRRWTNLSHALTTVNGAPVSLGTLAQLIAAGYLCKTEAGLYTLTMEGFSAGARLHDEHGDGPTRAFDAHARAVRALSAASEELRHARRVYAAARRDVAVTRAALEGPRRSFPRACKRPR